MIKGRLAQLVQSTSFTPRGSGVRTPHRPPLLSKYTDNKNKHYRAISSAGSEHLVYTEGVGGSNPSSPTKDFNRNVGVFYFIYYTPWKILLFTFYLVKSRTDSISDLLPILRKELFVTIKKAKVLLEM